MNLNGIVEAPEHREIFGFGGIGNPYILTQVVGFVIFMIAVQAELTQAPFDMPIAESELVSGYMTEYSGFRVPDVLHRRVRHRRRVRCHRLGALPRRLGFPFAVRLTCPTVDWAMNVLGPRVMLARSCCLVCIMIWVRFTYPRFREDQLQRLRGRSSSRSRS